MTPNQFLGLEEREKAFVVAAIRVKLDNDKKKAKEMKKTPKKGRKGR